MLLLAVEQFMQLQCILAVVLHFIEILDRQNIVCEQKRVISDMLVGKIIDDIVITTLVVDLDVR